MRRGDRGCHITCLFVSRLIFSLQLTSNKDAIVMKQHKHEQGQALVLIAFAIIGLVSITGLIIDGGMTYYDRRNAQNAADSAAMSAALAKIRGGNVATAATARAASNGYDNAVVPGMVVVNNPPAAGCDGSNGPYTGDNDYIQVLIHSNVDTYFAPVIGIQEMNNCVEAIARGTPPTSAVPFDGAAVIGLDPNGLSFDAWGNSDWYIDGGGIFANYDARKKNNKDNIHFLGGHCVTAVHAAQYFTCSPIVAGASQYVYPDDILPMLPPIPACDGVAYRGGDGKLHEEIGKEGHGSTVDHFEDDYAPGLYCITDAGGNIHGTVTGSDVTFYIADANFTMKFNGGGALAIQAPTSGPYAGVLMFSGITSTPCTQNIQFRGNGTADNIGTIFMPSACIDARGNSESHNNRTQIIGYNVTSNGTGDVYVSYNPDDNYALPIPPKIALMK